MNMYSSSSSSSALLVLVAWIDITKQSSSAAFLAHRGVLPSVAPPPSFAKYYSPSFGTVLSRSSPFVSCRGTNEAGISVLPSSGSENEKEGTTLDQADVVADSAEDNDDFPLSLKDLYRTVAEQDPEWFDSFVVNVLGQEEAQSLRNGGGGGRETVVSTLRQSTATRRTDSARFDFDAILQELGIEEKFDNECDDEQSESEIDGKAENDIRTTEEGSAEEPPEEPAITVLDVESDNSTTSTITDALLPETLLEDESIPKQKAVQDDSSSSVLDPSGAKDDDNEKEEEKETSSQDDKEKVVLFQETYQQSWTRAPLASLVALGYYSDDATNDGRGDDDIESLQPDALGLIVSEGIRRPKSGIPSRWRIRDRSKTGNNKERAVIILSVDEADQFVKAKEEEKRFAPRRSSDGAKSPRSTRGDALVPDTVQQDELEDTQQQAPCLPKTEWEGDESLEGSSERRSPRGVSNRKERGERTRYRDDGRLKPVYSGRQTTARMRKMDKDPPPPKSGLWPDIDTFRNLLRDEAGMRLRILGDGWSDVVKQESDWRLDLYKSWLWTLHYGVGEPIVESRSDRLRRINSAGSGDPQREQQERLVSQSPRREREPQRRPRRQGRKEIVDSEKSNRP